MLARVREGFDEKEMFELSFKGLKVFVFQVDQRGMGLPGRWHSISKGIEV